jgi:uncharacterized protein YlaI
MGKGAMILPSLDNVELIVFTQFHLSCLNLSQPPDGTWLCPECEVREQKEKKSRSKKNGTGGKVARKRS